MEMISIFTFIYLFIIYFDLVPIVKNKYNRLFTFNLIILMFSFLLVILAALEFNIPNPSNFIENIVRAII